jgi:hypothetical protein
MSYLALVKTTMVNAISNTFDDQYPVAQFQGVHASIEYPNQAQNYPGIWIDYDDTSDLVRAGIAHEESHDPVTGELVPVFTRWRFAGTATFTVVALTSLERDLLFDEVVNTIAFGSQDEIRGRFRRFVDADPYVIIEPNYDSLPVGGSAATPGTPWGTDEIVYERTVSLDMIGEFYPEMATGSIALLSRIQLDPPIATLPDGSPLIGTPSGPGVTDWH